MIQIKRRVRPPAARQSEGRIGMIDAPPDRLEVSEEEVVCRAEDRWLSGSGVEMVLEDLEKQLSEGDER